MKDHASTIRYIILQELFLCSSVRFVEALEFFNFTLHQFQSHTGRLHRPTLYYTGLCYLHQNDALTARKMFNAILRGNANPC